MPRLLRAENLTRNDIIKRYGWWYRVISVQIKGKSVGLTLEPVSSRPKPKITKVSAESGAKFEILELAEKSIEEKKKPRPPRLERPFYIG